MEGVHPSIPAEIPQNPIVLGEFTLHFIDFISFHGVLLVQSWILFMFLNLVQILRMANCRSVKTVWCQVPQFWACTPVRVWARKEESPAPFMSGRERSLNHKFAPSLNRSPNRNCQQETFHSGEKDSIQSSEVSSKGAGVFWSDQVLKSL
jgi:hypothetical protein